MAVAPALAELSSTSIASVACKTEGMLNHTNRNQPNHVPISDFDGFFINQKLLLLTHLFQEKITLKVSWATGIEPRRYPEIRS
jgi:hypothetical protein